MIARRDLPVSLRSRRDLSPACYSVELHSVEAVTAAPGQFGMLALGISHDPLLRRPFSLASVRPAGTGSVIELLVKEVGKATRLLRRLPLGTPMKLLAPLGNAFTLSPVEGHPLALVAGGIGLPPLLFAAEALAAHGVPFDLFVGARTAAELLAVERCRAAVGHAGGEHVLCTDDGTLGERGFVTTALTRRLAGGRRYARALACGPRDMLVALGAMAREARLDAELSLEEPMACGMGVCLGCVVTLAGGSRVASCQEGPVFALSHLAERWWE